MRGRKRAAKQFVLTIAASCGAARGAPHGAPARNWLREVAASSAERDRGCRPVRRLAAAEGVRTGEATLLLARAACRAGGACRGLAGASGASWQPPASRAARSRRCRGAGLRQGRGGDSGAQGKPRREGCAATEATRPMPGRRQPELGGAPCVALGFEGRAAKGAPSPALVNGEEGQGGGVRRVASAGRGLAA